MQKYGFAGKSGGRNKFVDIILRLKMISTKTTRVHAHYFRFGVTKSWWMERGG
jgi:hypothetical protein